MSRAELEENLLALGGTLEGYGAPSRGSIDVCINVLIFDPLKEGDDLSDDVTPNLD